MGRKVDIKKIEDITKCQVTFSKRRSSLMKKAHEISVSCDVDIAFVTFSPSGRVSKFCSQRRIEDVIHRYVNLPADMIYTHIKNVQEKREKLRQLDHIKGDTSKLHYLDKQIENLELQIKKGTLELQILEADIRDYEPLPEQDPSLHQLLWCERNLKQSLERVAAKKNAFNGSYPSSQSQRNAQVEMEKENPGGAQLPCNYDGTGPSWLNVENTGSGQLLMQLDPWISPYSAKVRETIFQGLQGQVKGTPVVASTDQNRDFPAKIQSGILSGARESQIPPPMQGIAGICSEPFAFQQPSNTFGNYMDTTIPMAQSNSNRGPSLQANGSFIKASDSAKGMNLNGQTVVEKRHQKNEDITIESAWLNPNPNLSSQDNTNGENMASVCANEGQYYTPDMENVYHHPKAPEPSVLDSLNPLEGDLEDNKMWTKGIQESGLWEWDDLVMVDNLNLEDLENFF